jgi:hypothetical protein
MKRALLAAAMALTATACADTRARTGGTVEATGEHNENRPQIRATRSPPPSTTTRHHEISSRDATATGGELFGTRLRELREERREPAIARDLTGITYAYISQMDRGLEVPSLTTIIRLAAALKCEVTDLMDVFNGRNLRKLIPKAQISGLVHPICETVSATVPHLRRMFHARIACGSRLIFESQGESQGCGFPHPRPSVSASFPTTCRALPPYLPSTPRVSRRRSRVRARRLRQSKSLIGRQFGGFRCFQRRTHAWPSLRNLKRGSARGS